MPTDFFTPTGSEQTWSVPSGVSEVGVGLWGGAGGLSTDNRPDGNSGGFTTGLLAVSGGETLRLYVGERGEDGDNNSAGGGGWPNGGDGASVSDSNSTSSSGGGGGSTDVRQGGSTVSDIVGLAGGAGGAGDAHCNGCVDFGEDGEDGNGSNNASGFDGENGTTATNSSGAAASGGGGGGLNGGATGSISLDAGNQNSAEGGLGGAVDTSGLSQTRTVQGGAPTDVGGELAIVYNESLSLTVVSGDQIDLDWTAPSSADGFDIYRDGSKIDSVGASTTTYSDTGLTDGTEHTYVIEVTHSSSPNARLDSATATTDLPAPTVDTIDKTASDELTVEWTKADDAGGDTDIYRSTDGSQGSLVTTVSASTTSFTDSGLATDDEFWYTIKRDTGDATASDQAKGGTVAAPTGAGATVVDNDQVDISWTDNSSVEDHYRVFRSLDGGSTWTQDSGDLAADTTSYSATGLLDGREYDFRVDAVVGITSVSDQTGPATTDLPDADQPALDNATEDQIDVDRGTQIHDNGDVRWQVRETGESSWSGSATGFDEGTVAFDTLTFAITGREDGEEYEVRLRTETTDATGAWTTPVSVITLLPAPTGLSSSNVTTTSVDLSWTDESDNETSFDVERRKDVDGTFSAWQTLATLAANTTSYTDDTVQPNRTYEYRIRVQTDDTNTASSTLSVDTATTDVRQRRVPSSGWYVEVETDAGEVLTPRLLSDPQINQTVNGLPELRIPVPYDTTWQNSAFEDATVRAYRDGQPQPVDTLVAVDVREGGGTKRTILTAEGGGELKTRVTKNVRFEDADVTARDLVDNNTTLTTNVDDPASSTTEVLMQDADTDSEWESLIPAHPFASDDPRHITGGELRVYDTALFRRGEDFDQSSSGWGSFFGGQYENGECIREAGINQNVSWDITTDYTIPSGDIDIQVRFDYFNDTHPGVEVTFGGETVTFFTADTDIFGNQSGPRWVGDSVSSDFSGTKTLEINITGAASDDSNIYVDAVTVVDQRYTRGVIEESLSNGGRLSWPELGPDSIQTVTEDTTALNQVVGGRIDSTWDNTANNQQIEASNDQGASYEISATNSQTASGSFSSNSGQIRGRLTQSYYDSGGGEVVYDSAQAVDLWQLYADQDNTPVLVDRSFDDRLLNVLQQIATDKDFLFELQVDRDYNFSFEMTRPGQRTSDRDTDVVSYDVKKLTGDIIEKAVVKGGRQRVRQEDFTSNHGTLVGLAQDDLIEGTEAVYDTSSGQQFKRGDDYEMDFLDGKIETLAAGAMADSTTYQIDYNYKPQATFTKAGVSSPKTVVRNFTDLQSEQTAEQLAQVLVRKFGDPIYEVTTTIPDTVGWSVIDEVDPSRVPTAGTSLQVVGIETTPEAVVARFESRGSPDEFVQRIRQRLGRAETRV